MASYLQINDLTKLFPIRSGLMGRQSEVVRAVDGVTLSVERGEILGLVGESGCGKSTLSRLLMQLIEPTSGYIELDGERLKNLSPQEMRQHRLDFQMIFQDPYASLNPRMTIFSTLAEALGTRHPQLVKNKSLLTESIAELMTKVGLEPRFMRQYPHEFSGGQRQRIAIARALAPDPKLVIADEPVSALDVSIQSQILNLLRSLQRDLGLTMIFISHDLSVVRYIADRIAVMQRGKIVELGDAEQVFSTPEADYTRTLLAAIPRIQH